MTTIGGLPAHVLLVHAVVVLVPLSALVVMAVAVWSPAQQRWAVPVAALAAVTAVLVPVTANAGEWLERRVEQTALLRAHTELGDTMTPWAIALAAVAVAAQQLLGKRSTIGAGGPGAAHAPAPPVGARRTQALSLALATLAVVVGAGSIVTVVRIGDSGARAAWTGKFTEQAQPKLHPPGAIGPFP